MRFSSRSHYGLRAMIVLAQAYHQGPLALAEIARSENLSLGYLEQLITSLRRAGLVKATRGSRGGYKLAVSPSQVSVGEVLRALEGPLAPAECASENSQLASCQREAECPSRLLWERVRDTVAGVLDSTTLADLCQQTPSGSAGTVVQNLV